MDERYTNHDPEDQEVFSGMSAPYTRSKEEMWAEMEARIQGPAPQGKIRKLHAQRWIRIVAAASVILLLGVTSFCRFHTRSIIVPRAAQQEVLLPDGSRVLLNADSKIAFHPYWWIFKRELAFEGEGYFEVEKGGKFTIRSVRGTTEVLGTSFNISTRNDRYEVYCATGRVKVIANHTGEEAILEAQMFAWVDMSIEVGPLGNAKDVMAWTEGWFGFSKNPLPEVFAELERQYDISIEVKVPKYDTITYSGYFDRPSDPETALNLICRSFDFTLTKADEKKYTIRAK